MVQESVTVAGLAEFRKACLALQDNKDFADAMKRVADIVTDEAKSRVPAVTGALRSTYKSRAAGAGARVVFGGPKAPYAPWMEFGGRKHGKLVGKTTKRTQPVDRERMSGGPGTFSGRYLYPAILANRSKVVSAVEDEMNTLIRRYGFELEETTATDDPGKDLFSFMRSRGAA